MLLYATLIELWESTCLIRISTSIALGTLKLDRPMERRCLAHIGSCDGVSCKYVFNGRNQLELGGATVTSGLLIPAFSP